MGIFNALSDAKDIINVISNIIGEFHQSPDDKAKNDMAAQKIAQKIPLAQIAVNQVEAQNNNKFASSWRPLIGYACVLFTVLNWVFAWINAQFGIHIASVGGSQPLQIITLLLGGYYMSLRTIEKIKGVA